MVMRKVASYVAAAGVILTAVAKVLQGEAPDWAEIMLAVSVFAAGFGFQKPSA